eukprot:4378246-Alexandrium_andersonii.AAC.1
MVSLIILAGFLDSFEGPLFDTVEYFAGDRAITNATRASRLRSAAYDIRFLEYGESEMLSVYGM